MKIGQVVLQDNNQAQWLCFNNPVTIIETFQLADVARQLKVIEEAVERRGLYAAGFLCYEAAPAFDPALRVVLPAALPLLWFGLYRQPEVMAPPAPSAASGYTIGDWQPSLTQADYEQAIARIKTYIVRGETYQVNYTFRLNAPFSGDPWAFFLSLTAAQRANYTAYVDTGAYALCSASPELFFSRSGLNLTSRPMKGTAARGCTLAEDKAQLTWLQNSAKNRAENVMIVDMIRNDLGRISDLGTVRVPRLFEVERYPTVWQMTSTVTAQSDASLSALLAALFPCASITGAPKVRAMQIIAELETKPRGIYTGCIGFVGPGRQVQFNVAIRTAVIDKTRGLAEYGVGGGIVWDSEVGEEYQECQLKARILTASPPTFDLLESILWEPDSGYFLLERHLDRLAASAEYYGIPADIAQVRYRLETVSTTLTRQPYKIRLLVSQTGVITTQATPLAHIPLRQPLPLAVADQPINSRQPFLYHKTTRRQIYEAARAAHPDAADVLLWNERGEVTESTIANVVVQFGQKLVTPPVSCGLLPGVYRAWLLEQHVIREEIITLDALKQGDKLYLINSVRKWLNAGSPALCLRG
jgi:para-aminobenzoate synthetase / 4-amino-4-deoxychorismate lyase